MLDEDLKAENLRVIASEHPLSGELFEALRSHPAAWQGLRAWVDYVEATGERIAVPEPTVDEPEVTAAPEVVRRPRWVWAVATLAVAVMGVAGAYATVVRPDDDSASEPVAITPSEPEVVAAAGDGFTCWASQSTVTCAGANQYGQLGSGSAGEPGVFQFKTASPVVQIGAGKHHACALLHGGQVACWGDNRWRQAGDVDEQILAPTVEPGVTASDLAVGEIHSCVVGEGGQVACWGSDYHGQLGSGGQGQAAQGLTVIDVPPATRVVSTRFGACSIGEQVYCWGSNDGNRLAPSEVPIVGPTVLEGVAGE